MLFYMSHSSKKNTPLTVREPQIFLLPNLMTAGNLCCGFFAILTIFKGMQMERFSEAYPFYEQAILLIFGACLFDLLDGRLARMSSQESPFGQEFDSLADIISFGMAPALLLSKAVLFNLEGRIGWGIAFVYLLCGAMRLARFNCLAFMRTEPSKSDFEGIPIPMAAGFIASVTFLLIDFSKNDRTSNLGVWNYVLGGVMLGLSFLMISRVRYPSFKKIDFQTRGTLWGILGGGLVIALLLNESTRWFTPTAIFTLYLLYGLLRPLLKKPKIFSRSIPVLFLGACLVFLLASTETSQARLVRRVIVDAGHGGRDKGANRGLVYEKNLALAVAKRVESLLKAQRIPVVMTRRDDRYITLNDRVAIANRYGSGTLFVSIHFNAHVDSWHHGLETYYYGKRSEALAANVHMRLLGRLKGKNRGAIVRKNLVVLSKTHCPAILVECGYISNYRERRKCVTKAYQESCAKAIVEGILSYKYYR